MELHIQLKSLADKINQLKDKIETEESTKHAFVLPLINIWDMMHLTQPKLFLNLPQI
jgi:hypothetical protein